jgi:two-component system chemotaxis response regulator CheB
MPNKIRVLVVDDSALVRQAIKEILSADPEIEVIGEARNGQEGYQKTVSLRPNVITMDLTMPVMGGAEAIAAIMEECPTPVIVVSSMDVRVIVKALAFGAMDFVAVTGEIEKISAELLEKVKIASRVRPLRRMRLDYTPRKLPVRKENSSRIVAIGVSTGGPQALQILFSKISPDFPAAILVVQHIASGFIQGLADWLGQVTSLHYQVAKAGDLLKPGVVYFAPDDVHMTVDNQGKIILKEDTDKKMLHVPAIDVMMRSVAEAYGSSAVGVIMTGMGRDGVEGISAIRSLGGYTIAQDEKTSAIYGMNKLAVDQGHIMRVLPLEGIADELARIVRNAAT